jgi:hypothetical protein
MPLASSSASVQAVISAVDEDSPAATGSEDRMCSSAPRRSGHLPSSAAAAAFT